MILHNEIPFRLLHSQYIENYSPEVFQTSIFMPSVHKFNAILAAAGYKNHSARQLFNHLKYC